MPTTLPSTAIQSFSLLAKGTGRQRFYYYIAPWGVTQSFRTKRAAMNFARRRKWVVNDQTR